MLASGCGTTYYERGKILAKVGGALSVVTVTTAVAMGPEEGGIEVMLYTGLPSLTMLGTALMMLPFARDRDERAARAREEKAARAKAEHDARVATRDRMWWLTKQAAAAARADDCAQVAVFEREVWTGDVDFYARVFARDVAIARCLQ